MLSITAYTIAAANTTQKLAGTTALTPAASVGIQNRDAAANLFVKTVSANGTVSAIVVTPGQYFLLGPVSGVMAPYDLDSIYVESTLLNHAYVVTKVRA